MLNYLILLTNCIIFSDYCQFVSFSMLDILAGRKAKKGISGTVLIDGEKQPNNFRFISGYVVQVICDSYHCITVEPLLMYTLYKGHNRRKTSLLGQV